MKKYSVIVLTLLLAGMVCGLLSCGSGGDPTAGIQSARPGDKVVAKVGKTVITDSQVAEKEKMFKFGEQKRSKVIDDLVTSRLLFLGAIKDKLDQDPDIKARIQEQVERILGQIYMNNKLTTMGKTDRELEDYYNAHKDDFRMPNQASLSHIVVATPEKAKQILDEIKAGTKTFEAAAQEYSDDKVSGKNGGRLGSVTEGGFLPTIGEAPEISKAVFEATTGAILGPFLTKMGYHLIRVDSIEKNRTEEFDKVKRQIIDTLLVSDKEIQEYYDKYKDERFKKKAFVKVKHIQLSTQADADKVLARLKKGEKFEDLAGKLSQDKYSATAGGDLGILYENGYIPRIGMDKTILDALFALNPGEISGVLPSKNGFHIFQVYEKSPEQYHDLAMVKRNIINILASQKRVEQRKTLMDQLEKDFKVERLEPPESPAKPAEAPIKPADVPAKPAESTP